MGWSRRGGRRGARARIKERHRTASVLLALLLLLAGACGSDEESASEDAAAASATAAAAVAEAEAAAAEAAAEDVEMAAAMAEEAMVEAQTLEEVQAELADTQAAAGSADTEAAAAAAEAAAEAAVMAAEEAEMATEEAMAAEKESDVSSVDDGSAGAVVELSTANSPAAFGRDVIYRAWVSVEAPDVAAATNQAISVVQGLGGFVFGQQTRSRPSAYSEIVFKVLPEDFSVALARLSQIGELVDQQISADDVTDRIVDLQSRITTAQASVIRLRSFLETATNLENVAFYEGELLIRETDLERLRGQVRTLQDQVALATITLAISQLPDQPIILPNTGLLVTAWMSTGGEDPCLGSKDISVRRDDTVNFCVEVANKGETTLTDVELHSDVLLLDINPFVLERGSFNRIEPGQFLTATLTEEMIKGRLASRIATRGLEILIEATATPGNAAGGALGTISDRTRITVTAQEVIPNPGIFVHAWVSSDDDDPCLGAKTVTVQPDDGIVNICVFVGNPGNTPITDVEIQSPALDLGANPLTIEHGGFERIEPGQFLTATLTETVEKGRFNGRVAIRGLDIEIAANATPLDPDGIPLDSVSDTTGVTVTAQEVLPNTRMQVTSWVSADSEDPCLGSPDISLEADDDRVNFCLEIGNLGDTALTDIRIESHSLPLEENLFALDHGSFERIEPGEFLTATLTESVENGRMAGRLAVRGIDVEITVTATPIDPEGVVLDDTLASTQVLVQVEADGRGDGSPTGFSDALDSSADALIAVLGGLAVVMGVLIPFLPFIAIVVAILWWRRRSRRRTATPTPVEPEMAEISDKTEDRD
ncbi:MAG: DUF4349 domain-containing protein [bacterium]|nr:DUF4349 domain-containing protein [bacterium]